MGWGQCDGVFRLSVLKSGVKDPSDRPRWSCTLVMCFSAASDWSIADVGCF